MSFSVKHVCVCIVSAVMVSQLPVPGNAAEITFVQYEALAKQYVQQNRDDFLVDPHLMSAYANRFLCADYLKERGNEFNLPKVLGKAADTVKAPGILPATYVLRTLAKVGTYDRMAGKFAFTPVEKTRNIFTFTDPMAGSKQQKDADCVPDSAGWPKSFSLTIENYDLIDGIPLPEDKAKAMLDLLNAEGNSQRVVGVNLTVAIKSWGKADSDNTVSATADIVDATLDDGMQANAKTLFTYDETILAARKIIVAKRLADEASERSNGPVPFNAENAGLWFRLFSAGAANTMADGTKLRALAVSTPFSLSAPGDSNAFSMQLFDKEMDITLPAGPNQTLVTTVVNKSDFQGMVPLDADDRKKLQDNAGYVQSRVILTPVGAQAEPPVLYAHADKIQFIVETPVLPKTVIEIPAKTPAAPYKLPVQQ